VGKNFEKELMQAKAYNMYAEIQKIIKLEHPVIIRVSYDKKMRFAGMYNLCDVITRNGLTEYHRVTIGASFMYSDTELYDTIAHELSHAKDVELGRLPLKHDAAFWNRLNKLLALYGLPKATKQHKKDCKAND